MKYLLILLFSFNLFYVYGQTPAVNTCATTETYFIKSYPNIKDQTKFSHIAVNGANDFYFTGGNGYSGTSFICKTNHNGDTLWARSLPGIYAYNSLHGIIATKDNGFLAFGYSYERILVIKGNSDGVIQWAEEIRDDLAGQKDVQAATELADGTFALSGSVNFGTSSYGDAAVWKISATGNVLWTKVFKMSDHSFGQGIIVSGNELLVTGYTMSKTVFYKGDGFVSSLNSVDGNVNWTRFYSTGDLMDLFFDIRKTASGEYLINANWSYGYVANRTEPSASGFLKINSNGDLIDWLGIVTLPSLTHSGMFIPRTDGSITGILQYMESPNNGYIFEMDNSTTFKWSKKLDLAQSESLSEADISNDGALLACGNKTNLGLQQTGFLLKADKQGNMGSCMLQDKLFPTVPVLVTEAIAPLVITGSLSNVSVSFTDTKVAHFQLLPGSICGTPDCKALSMSNSDSCVSTYHRYFGGDGDDQGLDVITLADKGNLICGKTTSGSKGLYDGFIARLNAEGSILWSKTIGSTGNDEIRKVKQLSDGSFIGIGTTATGSLSSILVVKLDANGNLIWNNTYKAAAGKNAAGKNIMETTDQKIVIAGTINDSLPDANGILIAIGNSGNEIWNTVFEQGGAEGLNGITELNGFLYAGGYVAAASAKACILKVDKTSGNIIWGKTYSHISGNYFNTCEDLVTANGNLHFMTIDYKGAHWGEDPYKQHLITLDANGAIISQTDKAELDSYLSSGYRVLSTAFSINTAGNILTTNSLGYYSNTHNTLQKLTNMNISDFIIGDDGGIAGLTFSGIAPLTNGGFVAIGKEISYTLKGSISNFVAIQRSDEKGRTGSCSLLRSLSNGSSGYSGVNIKEIAEKDNLTIVPATESITSGSFAGDVKESAFRQYVRCSDISCQPPVQSWSSCSNSYNLSYYTSRGGMATTYAPNADGTGTLTGIGGFGILWTNVAENGSIISSSTWGNDTIYRVHSFSVPMQDGGNISVGLAALGYIPNSQIPPHIELIRWDKSGKPLNGKLYKFGGLFYLTGMHAGSDGFIYVSGTDNNGFSPGFILKFNQNLDLVWSKKITTDYPTPVKDMLYKEGNLYAVHSGFGFDQNARVSVMKMDASNGDLLWNKTYVFPGNDYKPWKMFSAGNGLTVLGFISKDDNIFQKRVPGMLHIDTDGNFKTGVSFDEINVLDNIYNQYCYAPFTQTADNKFVMAAQCSKNYNLTGLVTIKFDTLGAAEWGWKYPALTNYYLNSLTSLGNHIFIAGRENLPSYGTGGYTSDVAPFLLKLKSDGLIKEETSTGKCLPAKYEALSTSFNSTIDIYDRKMILENCSPDNIQNTLMEERAMFIREVPACTEQAICQLSAIAGPEKICTLGEAVTFTINKHPDCKAPVTWKADESVATVTGYTDASVTVLFKAAGDCLISASILDGCTIKKTELSVKVSDQNKPADLGKDKEICPGQTVSLHAGKGFAQYMWQDNQTNTEEFTATLPGIYKVEVTDYCGKTGSASVEIKAAAPVVFTLGNDTALCKLDSVTLKAPKGMIAYTWTIPEDYKRINDSTVRIAVVKSFNVTALIERSPGCTGSDEIKIDIIEPPVIALGPDVKICENEPVEFSVADPASVQWNTGSKEHVLTVTKSGTYIATAKNLSGCTTADTVKVVFMALPTFSLGKDTSLCEGTNYELTPSNRSYNYTWQDGMAHQSISIYQPGLYWATTTNSDGCIFRDTLVITHMNKNPHGFMQETMEICIGRKYDLKADRMFDKYLWSNGSKQSFISVKDSGSVVLMVTDNAGCQGKDTIHITGVQCMKGIYMPNTFTPNSDGYNDVIKPIVYETITQFKLIIINRWGQKVFETGDPEQGWNGLLNGQPQPSGGFVYMMQYINDENKKMVMKGHVMLVR